MSRLIGSAWFYVATFVTIATSSIGSCADRTARMLLAVDGAATLATFGELKSNWNVTVDIDGLQKTIGRSEYALWGNYADDDRSSQVLLTDGTVLVGELVRIEAESVTISSRLWGKLPIDRRLVRACLLLPSPSPLERDRQWQLLQASEPVGRVQLINGDAITGKLLATTERDDAGLFGLVSVGIELSSNGATTSVKMEEVRAISFPAQASRAAQTECLLGFRDGSLVSASQITQPAPDQTRITTAAGARLELPTDELNTNLTFLQPRNETIDYLSDLPALGYKSLPFLTLDWPLGVARNTLGGRLRTGGNVIFKGLGMHSVSRVAYTFERPYRRFEAELALDDHAQRQGSVVYRVLVERESDSEPRGWKVAFTSPIVRGGDTPLAISLDVADATRLVLVVEMADRAHTRDYANWLNARLVHGPADARPTLDEQPPTNR